jgi:hypothetical protein
MEKRSRLRRSGIYPSDEEKRSTHRFRGSMREVFRRKLSPTLSSI